MPTKEYNQEKIKKKSRRMVEYKMEFTSIKLKRTTPWYDTSRPFSSAKQQYEITLSMEHRQTKCVAQCSKLIVFAGDWIGVSKFNTAEQRVKRYN